jgi:hypothetical protein
MYINLTHNIALRRRTYVALSVGLGGDVGAGGVGEGAAPELPTDRCRRDGGEGGADVVPSTVPVGEGAGPDPGDIYGRSYWLRRMLGPADLLLPESGLDVLVVAPRFVGVVLVEIERVCATVVPGSVNEWRVCPSRSFPLFLPYYI